MTEIGLVINEPLKEPSIVKEVEIMISLIMINPTKMGLDIKVVSQANSWISWLLFSLIL